MKKNIKKFLIPVFLVLLILMPAISFADSGLVTCGTSSTPTCDFNTFMSLINNVVHFILFDMAIPLAAIMFAYAGFILVTSGGSTEKRGTAKRIFTNVAIGLVLAVAAWLVIHLILSILGFDGSWIGL